MSEKILTPEVNSFIDTCSEIVGRWASDNFNMSLWQDCIGYEKNETLNMSSPIEHILYCALGTLGRINHYEDAEPIEIQGKHYVSGLGINWQKVIGKYRVDFEVFNSDRSESKTVLVECDSHQFHERTEKERRYEKERDCWLKKQGYTVLRFTGKEIIEDPFNVAAEILSFIVNDSSEDLLEALNERKDAE